MRNDNVRSRQDWVHGLSAAVLLAALWGLLSDWDTASWLVGLPAVLIAAWSMTLFQPLPAGGLSLRGLLAFVPYFVWESCRGGIDVARRTLRPRMRIEPGFFSYRTGLQQPQARVLFANCVSLIPGSLAADLDGDRILLHVLDVGSEQTGELQRLERAVAAIFPTPPRNAEARS